MSQVPTVLKSILFIGCFLFCSIICSAQNWDVDLLRKINPEHPTSDFWRGTTISAKVASVAVPVGMFATSLLTRDSALKRNAIETVASFAVTYVVTEGVKRIVDRQRPFEKYNDIYPYKYKVGQSFPSGHASVAFSTAASLSFQYRKWYVVVPSFVWATAAGYSRIYLGEHYPSDVLGSAVVGIGSAWLSHKANKWLRKKR